MFFCTRPIKFFICIDDNDGIDIELSQKLSWYLSYLLYEMSRALYPKNKIYIETKQIRTDYFHLIFNVCATNIFAWVWNYFSLSKAVLSMLIAILELKKHLLGEPALLKHRHRDMLTIWNIKGEKLLVKELAFNCYKRHSNIDKYICMLFRHLNNKNA